MGRLNRIEVVPVLRDGWLVYSRHNYDFGAPEFRERKSDALRYARARAKELGATLRIHNRHGRFQEERTYPHSRDPKRSRG